MRSFEMIRKDDETGISGTGKVVEGVVFTDGECVVKWVVENSMGRCVAIWPNLASFLSIHVYPHPDNKTEIIFDDGRVMRYVDGHFVETHPELDRKRRKIK